MNLKFSSIQYKSEEGVVVVVTYQPATNLHTFTRYLPQGTEALRIFT